MDRHELLALHQLDWHLDFEERDVAMADFHRTGKLQLQGRRRGLGLFLFWFPLFVDNDYCSGHCCFFPCRRVLSVVLSVIRERLHEGTKIFDHQLEYTFVQDSGVTGSSFLIMLGSKCWLGPMFVFKVGWGRLALVCACASKHVACYGIRFISSTVGCKCHWKWLTVLCAHIPHQTAHLWWKVNLNKLTYAHLWLKS